MAKTGLDAPGLIESVGDEGLHYDKMEEDPLRLSLLKIQTVLIDQIFLGLDEQAAEIDPGKEPG